MDVRKFIAMITTKKPMTIIMPSETSLEGVLERCGLPTSKWPVKRGSAGLFQGLISVLRRRYTTGTTERQSCRLPWSIYRARIATALVLTMQAASADAAPRMVVLLDFSRPVTTADPAAKTAAERGQSLSEVARAMASQFTGAPLDDARKPSGSLRSTSFPGGGATAFSNPFTLYVLAFRPPLNIPSVGGDGDCVMPVYRPSFAFGHAAEERRRILFPLVHRAACEAGLPVGLFDAMIMQESRYQPAAISSKGAFGLAQLMPGTASQLRVDRFSLQENLRGGARYLKQHFDRFGRYDLALAAYNAGPGRVERRWQVPAITETQEYVRTIIANWTGVAPLSTKTAVPIARPLPLRRAQLVFMPAPARISGGFISQFSTPIG